MAHRPAVFPHFQVFADEAQRHRVNGNEPDFIPLSLNAEMHHALAALDVAQAEEAQLLTADAVIEQGGEDCPIAHAFERIARRRIEQPPRLGVAKGRGAALIIIGGRPLDAVHGIAQDGIALTEIIEQRRQRGELAPDGGWPEGAQLQILRQAITWARAAVRRPACSRIPVKAMNSATSLL